MFCVLYSRMNGLSERYMGEQSIEILYRCLLCGQVYAQKPVRTQSPKPFTSNDITGNQHTEPDPEYLEDLPC